MNIWSHLQWPISVSCMIRQKSVQGLGNLDLLNSKYWLLEYICTREYVYNQYNGISTIWHGYYVCSHCNEPLLHGYILAFM